MQRACIRSLSPKALALSISRALHSSRHTMLSSNSIIALRSGVAFIFYLSFRPILLPYILSTPMAEDLFLSTLTACNSILIPIYVGHIWLFAMFTYWEFSAHGSALVFEDSYALHRIPFHRYVARSNTSHRPVLPSPNRDMESQCLHMSHRLTFALVTWFINGSFRHVLQVVVRIQSNIHVRRLYLRNSDIC